MQAGSGSGAAETRAGRPGPAMRTLLAVVFFGLVSPLAMLLRLAGRDRLRLKPDPRAETYWIARAPVRAAQTAMRRQS
jgi:hypothetical protein